MQERVPGGTSTNLFAYPCTDMRAVLFALLAAPFSLASPLANTAFIDPTLRDGSWLDNAGNGLGEPLNVTDSYACFHAPTHANHNV